MNPPLRAGDFAGVGEWGRWDVAGHRTIYAAHPRKYAYQEALAYLTPSAKLRQLDMSDVFDDLDFPAGTVLESIAKDWEGKLRPDEIARQWRDERTLYELELPQAGWFIDIGHGDSLTAMNRSDGPVAGLIASTRLLTLEDLFGTDRALTCAIATLMHQLVLDDGWQAHGIHFRSKWGTDGGCWAVWLRATDDGAAGHEPTRVLNATAIAPMDQDADLKAAAQALGLGVY